MRRFSAAISPALTIMHQYVDVHGETAEFLEMSNDETRHRHHLDLHPPASATERWEAQQHRVRRCPVQLTDQRSMYSSS